jgi:hypothetical protein
VTGIVTMAVGASLALGVSSCSSNPRPALVVDCSVTDPYEFDVLEQYSTGTTPTWFGYGDMTPGGLAMTVEAGGPDAGGLPRVLPIEGGICGIQDALVLASYGHQDYGSGFGDYSFGGFSGGGMCDPDSGLPEAPAKYVNASQYEGLSFWARNPGETTKGLTLELSDIHSTTVKCPTSDQCLPYSNDAGNNLFVPISTNGTVQPGSGLATAQPPADACGNSFSVAILTTENWQLYTIPFSSFNQAFQPDRIPSGLDTAKLALFTVVVPKESVVDLWIANLGFYRTKAPEAGP